MSKNFRITRREMVKAIAVISAAFGSAFLITTGFGSSLMRAVSRVGAARRKPATAQGHPVTPAGAVTNDRGVTIRQLLVQPLNGFDNQNAVVLEVEYAPGAGSSPHRHPGPAFGYVLEGAVVVQIDQNRPITYTQGQMWYEAPMQVHRISRNASRFESAKMLAFVIAEGGHLVAEPLSQAG